MQANPEQFGGLIAKGEQQFGAGVSEAGDFWQQVQVDHQQNAQLAKMDQLASYAESLKGQDALDQRDNIQKQFEQIVDEGRNGLTPKQQLQYDNTMRAYQFRFFGPRVNNHLDQQGAVVANATQEASLNQTLDFGGRATNTPEQTAHFAADAARLTQGLYVQRYGKNLPQPLIDQANREGQEKVWGGYINALASDPKTVPQAVQLLQQQANNLSPQTYDTLMRRIQPQLENAQANAYIAAKGFGTPGVPGAAPTARPELIGTGSTGRPEPPPEIASTIETAAKNAGVDPAYLKANAGAESSFRTDIKAPTSSASGLFQFTDQTWLQSLKDHGAKYGLEGVAAEIKPGADGKLTVSDPAERQRLLDLRLDPTTASQMAAELTATNRDALQKDLGREPGPTDLYAAHFLGAPGAAKLISAVEKDPNESAAALLPAAAEANRPVFYNADGSARTVSQLYQTLATKIGGAAAPTYGPNTPLAGPNAPPLPAYRDYNALRLQAANDLGADSPLFTKVNEKISREEQLWRDSTEQTRQYLQQNLSDIEASALAGNLDTPPFPEAAVRSVYPPEFAEHLIEKDQIERRVGQVSRSLQFASPEEFNKAYADITSGQGVWSQSLGLHKTGDTGPGAAGASPDAGTADFFKLREAARNQLGRLAQQRFQALANPETADPALYVRDSPTVQQAWAPIAAAQAAGKAPTADQYQNYANASLAVQTNMGVPVAKQHVLTRSEAQAETARVTDLDGDPLKTIQDLQAGYGKSWGKAFADMVQLGGLPGQYETLPNLDHDPENAKLLALGLNVGRPTKDGKPSPSWDEALGQGKDAEATPAKINDDVTVNPIVHNLKAAWAAQVTPPAQISERISAITTLAMARVLYKGESVGDAIDKAAKAFTSGHDLLPGQPVLVPKSSPGKDYRTAGEVGIMAQDLLDHASPQSVATPPFEGYDPRLVPTPQQYLNRLRSQPHWSNTQDGEGMVLKDWTGGIVKDPAGNNITVSFTAPFPARLRQDYLDRMARNNDPTLREGAAAR